MNEFIITFRECLEASLIVGIIYTFLVKTGMKTQIKYLWSAVGSAILASIIVALILEFMFDSIQNEVMQALFEAIFMYITAGLLLYVVFWLSKSVSDRGKLEKLAYEASQSSKWGIFLLIFFAILREGFETVIFLHGEGIVGENGFSYTGFSLGILIAILIGYLIFSQGKKLNLKPFFAITTFFLVLFASGMSAYGTHEIEEYMLKKKLAPIKQEITLTQQSIKDGWNRQKIDPDQFYCNAIWQLDKKRSDLKEQMKQIKEDFEKNTIKSRPWNILKPTKTTTDGEVACMSVIIDQTTTKEYHVLHDKGEIGVFLKGLFGYNSNPNWIELIIWVSTLVFGMNIWKKYYLKTKN